MSISSTQSDIVHVVAGVICNAAGEVLLAQRPAQAHLGGLWEFPGGKLNQSEAPFVGLVRELREELLGIQSGTREDRYGWVSSVAERD